MNKKGFTLIEAIATITVLSMLSLIIVPRIMNLVTEARLDNFYNQQLMVERAAREEILSRPALSNDGDSMVLSVEELQNANKLSKSLELGGYVIVTRIGDDNYDIKSHLGYDDKDIYIDGLLGHWPLINDTYDYTPANNHGQLIGSPEISEGILGDAYRFVNDSQHIRVEHDSTLSSEVFGTSDVHTLMGWVYVEAYQNWATMINKATGGSWSNTTSGIWVSDQGGITFALGTNEGGNPSGSHSQLSYPAAETNKWYHVAGVADGSRQYLYLNGELVADRSIGLTRTRSENTAPIILGRRRAATGPTLRGMIQDVRVYNRNLSANEIKLIYNLSLKSVDN